jgi:hypothetical protein
MFCAVMIILDQAFNLLFRNQLRHCINDSLSSLFFILVFKFFLKFRDIFGCACMSQGLVNKTKCIDIVTELHTGNDFQDEDSNGCLVSLNDKSHYKHGSDPLRNFCCHQCGFCVLTTCNDNHM